MSEEKKGYQLFDEEQLCRARFPVHPVQSVLRFQQFTMLECTDERQQTGPLVLPLRFLLGGVAAGNPAHMTVWQPEGVGTEPEGGLFPFASVRKDRGRWGETTVTVHEEDLDRLESSGLVRLQEDREPLRIEVCEGMTRTLREEGRLEVRLQDRDTGITLAMDYPEFLVEDLAGFLAEPVVFSEGKPVVPVLDRQSVDRLINRGRTVVQTEQGPFTVVNVKPDAPVWEGTVPGPVLDRPLDDLKVPVPELFPRLRFEIGLLSTFSQSWSLLGYTRGELVTSFSLAPEEEMTIETFTWDRRKLEEEEEFGTEYEHNRSFSSSARQSLEVIRETSRTLDWSMGLDAGITIPIKNIPLVLKGQGQTAQQLRQSDRHSRETIAEAVRETAEQFRASRRVKIVQTRETGQENRTTRKIANPNRSRTLNLDTFEVLEHYRVITGHRPERVRPCILVPNPDPGPFDLDFVLHHEDVLAGALLSPVFMRGFEAARILSAYRWHQLRPWELETHEEEGVVTAGTADPAEERLRRAAAILKQSLETLIAGEGQSLLAAALNRVNPLPPYVTGEQWEEAKRRFSNWLYWTKAQLVKPGLAGAARQYIGNMADPHGAPLWTVAEDLQLFCDAMDSDFWTKIKDVALVTLALARLGPGAVILLMGFAHLADDAGFQEAIRRSRGALAEHDRQRVLAEESDGGETAPWGAVPAADVFSQRELAQAQADFHALAGHLQVNATHYKNAIWRAEDGNARWGRLSQYGQENITHFIENELLGFIGEKSVYPLRSGAEPDLDRWLEGVLEEAIHAEAVPIEEELTLPTTSVQMEARLGACDALEDFLTEHRRMDLERTRLEVQTTREELRQAQEETRRLKARLATDPPELGGPGCGEEPVLRVVLDDARKDGR